MPAPTNSPPTRRRASRAALVVPIVGSAVIHAALAAGLIGLRPEVLRTARLTDVGADEVSTSLDLAPPAPPPAAPPAVTPVEPPAPEPAPAPEPEPEPEPAAQPEPEPAAAEPEPAPAPAPGAETVPVSGAEVVLSRPARPEPGPAEPEPAEPAPGPGPARVVSAPPAGPSAPPAPAPIVFAGQASQAAGSVVYAIDASGPMASSLPYVIAELERSVRQLSPSQRFAVLAFREPPPDAPGQPAVWSYHPLGREGAALLEATDLAKAGLSAWAGSIRPLGRSAPLAALRAALELEPDLVILLSRSIRRSGPRADSAADVRSALRELDALNPASRTSFQRRTVIKTVQFVEDDPTGLLQSIANSHGDGPGSYRVVTIEQMDQEP